MPLKVQFLGHASYVLDDGTHRVAIDPFLTDNPHTSLTPADIKVQWVALTHGHFDHFGDDALAIMKNNAATLFAINELCEYCGEQGIEKMEPCSIGGRVATDFGWMALTPAFHSASYQGRYMGMPCGLIVHMAGVTFYHLGDTGLFGDMKLIGELYKPDIAAIPVGDRFTMGPEMGARAAEMIQPKVALPMHYGTWPLLTNDISAFEPAGIEVKVLQPGETWTYDA